MKKSTNYRIEIITPERVLFNQEVTFAVISSGLGPIGVLPNHAPLLGTVLTGALKLRDMDKRDVHAFVRNGFFMVSHEGVSIVARSAELEHQIDVKRATAAKERAQQILATRQTGMDMERAKPVPQRTGFFVFFLPMLSSRKLRASCFHAFLSAILLSFFLIPKSAFQNPKFPYSALRMPHSKIVSPFTFNFFIHSKLRNPNSKIISLFTSSPFQNPHSKIQNIVTPHPACRTPHSKHRPRAANCFPCPDEYCYSRKPPVPKRTTPDKPVTVLHGL